MLLFLLAGPPQVVEETEHGIKAGGKRIVGSFEKAVPVIFKPRGVRRPLFPWLLTGLHSFRGASERADNGDVATQVPNPRLGKARIWAELACGRAGIRRKHRVTQESEEKKHQLWNQECNRWAPEYQLRL